MTDPAGDADATTLDFTGVDVSIDRGLGTVSFTSTFAGSIPEHKEYGSRMSVLLAADCDASARAAGDAQFVMYSDYEYVSGKWN